MLDQNSQPEFDYTRLNDIKPGLIAEATAAARESAEQFAKDSGSRLGGIRNANQGVVTISDRDQSSPQVKKVRVVTTVEYFLRDCGTATVWVQAYRALREGVLRSSGC